MDHSDQLGVHLAYTVPAIGVLWLATRPLLCRADYLKITLVTAATVAYASQRGGGVVSAATPGASASVAAQTILTLLWSAVCFRWSTPCLNFNLDRRSYQLIRWAPICALLAVVAVVVSLTGDGPETSSWSRVGDLLRWSFPAVAVAWFGAGNLFARRTVASAVAVAVPVLYLCWADRAFRPHAPPGPGHPPPPPGHARLFHAAVTALTVLAATGYDKAAGMADVYPAGFPHQFAYSPRYVAQLCRAFFMAEYSVPAAVVHDIRQCFHVLNVEATTFAIFVLIFQGGTRLDMVIVYAFARVTDEIFDSDMDPEKKQRYLKMCYNFLNEIFPNRKTKFHVTRKPESINIDWAKYEQWLNESQIASFRALSRIAYYLPSSPFFDLLDAFQGDIDGKIFETEEDLMTYTHQVAGINGLSVGIMLHRDYNDRYFEIVEKGKNGLIIGKAYDMGQAMQFVNIARDIVKDSIQLSRCYIPLEYMDDAKNEAKALCQEKNPRSLGDSKLKKYANKIINLTEKFQSESDDFFKSLPSELRGLNLALYDIYLGYIPAIQSSPNYPTNAKLSRWSMIKIGLHSLYVKNLQYGIY